MVTENEKEFTCGTSFVRNTNLHQRLACGRRERFELDSQDLSFGRALRLLFSLRKLFLRSAGKEQELQAKRALTTRYPFSLGERSNLLSHDLEIVTKEFPEHRRITEFIESRPGLALEGKLGPQEGNLTVSRKFKGVLESIIQVWGPDEAEPEDLADAITQAVKPPYWLVRITVPTAVKETVQLGEALAIHIAKGHGGLVYDPQAGSVIWPKMQVRPVSRSSDHERIRVVTLAWYLPPSQASTSMAQTFL
jgi:hypothetical protein